MLNPDLLKIPGLALKFAADADLEEPDADNCENPVRKFFELGSVIGVSNAESLSKIPGIEFRERGDVPLAKRQGNEWDEPIGAGSLEKRAPQSVRIERLPNGWCREYGADGELTAIYKAEDAA